MTELEERVLSHIEEKEVVEFMQTLIRCKSVFPPGDTREVAQTCKKKLDENGIDAEMVYPPIDLKGSMDDHVDNSKIPSVLAKIGNGKGKEILWNAHIDTVPVEDWNNWKYDPFSGKVEDGYIYGRGAGDDKGGVAAQIMAAIALKRAGIELNGTVVINPVADEEGHGLRGTSWLLRAGYYHPDIVMIGEQTLNRAAIAERAYTFFTVIIKGKACHGAMPWNGNNAAVKAARFIHLIDSELAPKLEKRTHPYLPHSTVNVAKIHGGVKENVVPELCEVTIDRRIVPGETIDGAIKEITDLLDRLKEEDPFEYSIRIEYKSGVPTDTKADDPAVNTLLNIVSEVTGEKAEPTGYCQGSDSRWFAQMNIPIMILGPSDPAVGHSPNERISVQQLMDATKIYALSALRMLGVQSDIK